MMNLRVENVAKYLAFGLEVPGTILGGVVLGYLADAKFGTGPWLTILGSVLGFVGAVFRLIKYLKFFSGEGNQSSAAGSRLRTCRFTTDRMKLFSKFTRA